MFAAASVVMAARHLGDPAVVATARPWDWS